MTIKPKIDAVKLGQELAQKLNGVTNEAQIRRLTIDAIKQITEAGITLKRPLGAVRKEIEAKFPPVVPATGVKPKGYYFTDTGQGRVKRFEHLALWYLTENADRRNVTGDDARKQYWQGLPKFGKETETSETSEKHPQKATEKPTKPTNSTKPTETTKIDKLKAMTIDDLKLDEETKEILELALKHSGLDLAEFMQKAVKTYANTITGKIRRLEEDSLEGIPTVELLNNPKYSTYPGRAEEMVRRAIQAIKIYNSEVATEPKQRWIITQSLLSELTGSRGSVVQAAMKKYADDIESHNKKYPDFLNEDGSLNQYFNRKRGVEIREVINLEKLVPNG